MAGLILGATAPALPAPPTNTGAIAARRSVFRVPASTRTRRLQGVCLAGGVLLSVHSSRRDGAAAPGVSLTLHDGLTDHTGTITPTQARALAQAIEAAAVAAESAVATSINGEG